MLREWSLSKVAEDCGEKDEEWEVRLLRATWTESVPSCMN